ncbi:hypothetical protein D7X33_29835 [Butyricicoccus sp. 1XD8-22]|nr:hypothetical protein D7X33_29835 [Butyricicoccus sp. 1XD8-22]
MKSAFSRLDELFGDTLQILDHMKVDSEYQEKLDHIIKVLKEQKLKVGELSNYIDDKMITASSTMKSNLFELNKIVLQLEEGLLEDYKKSTDNDIDQYESLPLEEQQEQDESYHNKIDYLSAVKIRDNIKEMQEIINSLEK